MKKQAVKRYEVVFDAEEVQVLKYVIDYAWHRAAKHDSPVSPLVTILKEWKEKLAK